MEKVRLLSVVSESYMTKDGFKEIYHIMLKVGNKMSDFYSDLKNGVKKETEKIYNPQKYDYKCFESMYGRNPKNI